MGKREKGKEGDKERKREREILKRIYERENKKKKE